MMMTLGFVSYVQAVAIPAPVDSTPTPLERLMAGNKRYVEGKSSAAFTSDAQKRVEVMHTQKPFAIVLGCSDSRVPLEVVFDQRIGDLFVIRVAGNVVDDVVLGSIEYAVKFLEMPDPFILVLGHERCGAVSAAVKATQEKVALDNHIASIVNLIKPAVLKTKPTPNKDFVDEVIIENVRSVVQKLKTSPPVLMEAVKNNRLKIMGAYYDLETGSVQILE